MVNIIGKTRSGYGKPTCDNNSMSFHGVSWNWNNAQHSWPLPSFWVRFIDDILLQWAYSIEEFNIFLHKLTQAENLINLQVEWESAVSTSSSHATIPFLDLNISRSPQGLNFSVYRKPTHTDLYTHYYLTHPATTKRGVLISLFLRAHRLWSTDYLQKEIEHLRSTQISRSYYQISIFYS